jgi:non-canonical (house-cleaning) NTP pyrophosphatase
VIIAVGSTRGPKVEAVRRVLEALRSVAPELAGAEVVPIDASADAPPMPLSLDELLDGARSRAQLALEAVRGQGRPAVLGIGLEGGIDLRRNDVTGRRGFLMSWAYVTDGRRGAHGCGGGIEVPVELLDTVVEDGIELSEAIDAFAQKIDVRSREGAWGVLTRGFLDRTRSFEIALVNALAPFYNEDAYRSSQ